MTAPKVPALAIDEELKRKLLFTLLAVLIYRIGAHITAPGVDPAALVAYFNTSGAAGFLNKETAPDLLIAAVRKVAEGGKYVTPELAEHLATFVAKGERAPHETLTNRELQVLVKIGSGKTVSEIARELSLSVKTVSTHRVRILAKMGMRTNAELTAYAVKNALV